MYILVLTGYFLVNLDLFRFWLISLEHLFLLVDFGPGKELNLRACPESGCQNYYTTINSIYQSHCHLPCSFVLIVIYIAVVTSIRWKI